MLSFREWLCLRLPWHKWRVIREYGRSRHIRCTHCGREYGMNDDARVILPWHDVREAHYPPGVERKGR